MPKILIIEPYCTGHHATYVRWIVKGAIERGYEVQVATLKSSLGHSAFQAMQSNCNSGLQILTTEETNAIRSQTDFLSLIKNELYYRKLFAHFYHKSCQTNLPDIILIPYLDYCSHVMALLGSPFGKTLWSGIVMRPAFHFSQIGIRGPCSRLLWIKKVLFFRLLQNPTLKTLFTIDEALGKFIQETKPLLSKRLCYLPEPAELNGSIFKKEARQRLGIAEDAILILVYGAIDSRKGFDALLFATQEPNFPENVHILLAGKQGKETEDFLIKSPLAQNLLKAGRLHQINSFLNDEEEYKVFVASDIVWLGYRGHYNMSGVLVQAGQMGLPVIACREGLVGWLTDKYQLGITVSITDKKQVATAIDQLVQSEVITNGYKENGQRFFTSHTPEHFSTVLFDSLENNR